MNPSIGSNHSRMPSSILSALLDVAAVSGIFLAGIGLPAAAAELGKPTGPVVLEIRGKLGVTNDGDMALFDLGMLEKLGLKTVKTSTVWTDGGARAFEGVLARDVMAAVDAPNAKTVMARALNDYAVEIPVADFYRYDVIFAMRMDGQQLTARDKGPLWVVYPRDDNPELQDERIDQRWAWQVYKLEVN